MPKTICSCSMGKDSLATVILALMHHEPLDEIVYCEVMFDKEISGEVPEHRTFIYETAIPWLRRAGLNVKILRANTTYKESKPASRIKKVLDPIARQYVVHRISF